MKFASVLAFFALLSAAQAAPKILSRTSNGVVVNADFIRHYSELCQRYPQFGDKVGAGVFILDVDQFRLDNKHYVDYLSMTELEKNAASARN